MDGPRYESTKTANRQGCVSSVGGLTSRVTFLVPCCRTISSHDGWATIAFFWQLWGLRQKLEPHSLYCSQQFSFSVHCEHRAETNWTCCQLPTTITEISYATRLGVLP
jgi:hypothetical protein